MKILLNDDWKLPAVLKFDPDIFAVWKTFD